MPGISVGSASVRIVPDASQFPGDVDRAVTPAAAAIGRQIGSQIVNAIQDAFQRGLRNAPTGEARRAGASAGGSFADSFRQRVDAALRTLPSIRLDGDSTEVDRKLDEIRNRLLALSSRRIGVDLDSEVAVTELRRLQAELDELGSRTPDIAVRANIARAQEQLGIIQAEVDRLDGRRADVDVRVDDHGSLAQASTGVSGLAAGLITLAPLAIPLGAALIGAAAGAGAGFAAAAAGAGVLALGVSGVSNAVKLLGQRQQAAAQDAAKASTASTGQAAAEAAAANQIRSAQQSLADARLQASRQAVDDNERIKNARQALADAERQADQQDLQSARAVSDARVNLARVEQDAADRSVQAARAVADAERGLATANRNAADAQQALNDAREQAARDLESSANNAADAQLSAKQAAIDLTRAQTNLTTVNGDATATDVDRQQAALDLAKAQQELVEAQQHATESSEDNTKAQAAGVDGSQVVLSAQQQLTDSLAAQTQAEQTLTDAQADQTKQAVQNAADIKAAQQQVTDAEVAQAQQARASAEQVAKAQQGVADAVRSRARDEQDAATRVARAQEQVGQAMQAAALAAAGSGAAGATALAGIDAQLAKVNPATLQFATFWRDTVLPMFDRVKGAAAAGLLPGLEQGLKAVQPLLPTFARFVGMLAGALGGLFAQAGRALDSPFWRQFFDYIGRVAGPYLQTFGRILGNFAMGFAGLLEAFEPVTTAIGSGLLRLSQSFASFGAGASSSSGFGAFIAYIRREGPVVVDVFRNIFEIVGKLIQGLAPVGAVMLVVVRAVTGFLAALPPSVLTAIAIAIGAAAAAIFILNGALALLALNPIVLAVAAIVAAVAAAAYLIATHWDAIKTVFSDAWNWISDFVTSHWKLIVSILGGPIGAAVVLIVSHWDDIKHAFTSAVDWVTGAFSTAWSAVKNVVTTPIHAASEFLAGVFGKDGAIRSAFTSVSDWVQGAFAIAWGVVKTVIVNPIKSVVETIGDLLGAGKNGLQAVFSAAVSAISRIWAGLKATFTEPIKFLIDTVLNNGLIWAWNKIVGFIPGLGDKLVIPPLHPKGFAVGGGVSGPGTGTSDSIWAKLSNGEHVWTAKEVDAVGGHRAVESIRSAGLGGGYPAAARAAAAAVGNDIVPAYKTGGEVITDTVNFIKSTDPLPYVFGAVGPNAFDCSGLVGAAWAMLTGKDNPFQRWFSTYDEANYFKPGTGVFTVGITNSGGTNHTAGRLGNLGFEARDTQEGIIIGSQAKSPESFDSTMYLPLADTLAKNLDISKIVGSGFAGGGVDGVVNKINPLHWYNELKADIEKPLNEIKKYAGTPVGDIIAGIPGAIGTGMLSSVKSAIDKLGGPLPGTTNIDPAGTRSLGMLLASQAPYRWTSPYSEPSRWTPSQAAQWAALDNLWTRESGWSPIADTRRSGLDPANASVYAYGIPQARPASKLPLAGRPSDLGGHSDPGAQIGWGLNYILGRYGDPAAAWAHELSAGWYDQGGWLEPGHQLVYNGTGQRELVLPHETAAQILGTTDGAPVGPASYTVIAQFGDETVKAQAHTVLDDRLAIANERGSRGVRPQPGQPYSLLAR